jgi:hypothetical protein
MFSEKLYFLIFYNHWEFYDNIKKHLTRQQNNERSRYD